MPMRRAIAAATLAVLVAAGAPGCGGNGSSTSSTSESPGGGTLLKYHRSGGIAYSNIFVVVDSDGAATIKALGPTGARTQEVTVDAAQLDRLKQLIGSISLSSLPKRRALGCADCYQYQVAYGGGRFATDEASAPAPLKPLIAIMESIISQTSVSTPTGK